jgi:DNA-binding transcriptional LysR family regulator
MPVALGRQTVMPHLPAFLRAYPDVRLELNLSDRLTSLAQEGFDLAIRHTEHPPETHVAWRLADTRAVLVATRTYLAERGTPQHPSELARHDCLHYIRPGDAPTWQFREEQAAPGTQASHVTVAVRGPFSANNSEVLREAAVAGLGIALLPDFSAGSALATGQVVPVLQDWRSVGAFGGHLYALRPYSPHVPRTVLALVGHLRQAMDPHGGQKKPTR